VLTSGAGATRGSCIGGPPFQRIWFWPCRVAGSTCQRKSQQSRRFIELLRENEDELITWRDVFNEEKQMPGHQSKYQYLIDRTYLRPGV